MNGNIKIGSLFGIPFYVNYSWFLILGLVTLSFSTQLKTIPDLNSLTALILGFITALLMFASVLAHELGHSLVALAQGIKVKSITLFLFGGLANLEKESSTPLQAFLVAIGGPAVSFLLCALFTVFTVKFSAIATLTSVFILLAQINLALGLFNLIPGLPLDGGNIVKAIVWQITGNPNKGIIFASRFGQLFGWLGIIVGIAGTLNILPFGSIWTLLIGWFILQNAGFSAQYATVQEKLTHLTVEDAVSNDSPIVFAGLNLREFANNYVIGQDKWKKFLVTNDSGQLLGAVITEDMKKIPTSLWLATPVNELIQPIANQTIVNAELSLWEAIKILETENLQELTVIRKNGTLVGLLEKASIIEILQKQAPV